MIDPRDILTDPRLRGYSVLTHPLTVPTRVLTGLLAADALANAYQVPQVLTQARAEHDVAAGTPHLDPNELAAVRDAAGFGAMYVLWLFAAAGIAFLVWLWRARANVAAYEPCYQRHRRGWAVAGWLVPVVNLVVPYRVMTDLVLDSRIPTPPRRRGYWVLRAWWLLWVVTNVTDLVSVHLRDPLAGGRLNVVSRVTEAAAALLLIVIVRRVARWQAAREVDELAIAWAG